MQCVVSASSPLQAVADVVVLAPYIIAATHPPCPHTAIAARPPSSDIALPDRTLPAVHSVNVLD